MTKLKMKACRIHGVNDIKIDNIPVPTISDTRDAIVKVTLSTICSSDIHYAKGDMGLPKIQTIGHEFCGEIVDIGSDVKDLEIGDKVLAKPAFWCGECEKCEKGLFSTCSKGGCLGVPNGPEGCFAEFCRVQFADTSLTKIPNNLREEEVIMISDVLSTAYFGLTNGSIKKGDNVVIYGVGPIGMSACLLAKVMFKANKVIAVDINEDRLNVCKDQGIADVVLDASKVNILEEIPRLCSGSGCDLVIDTIGTEDVINNCLVFTDYKGTISSIAITMQPVTIRWDLLLGKNLTLKSGAQVFDGCEEMLSLIEEGKLDLTWMNTHRSSLDNIIEAYEVFGNQADGCIKWLLTPFATKTN